MSEKTEISTFTAYTFSKDCWTKFKISECGFFLVGFFGIKSETNQGVEIVSFFYFCSIKIYQMFLKFILDIDRTPNQNRPSLILDLSRSGFWDLRVKKIYLHITGQVKSVSIQNLVVLNQKLNELSSFNEI